MESIRGFFVALMVWNSLSSISTGFAKLSPPSGGLSMGIASRQWRGIDSSFYDSILALPVFQKCDCKLAFQIFLRQEEDVARCQFNLAGIDLMSVYSGSDTIMTGIDARLDASPISRRKHVEKDGSLPKILSINLDTEKKYSICKTI